MSIKYMNAVWQNRTISGSKRLVLLALADNANDEGLCWPSYETIATKCNISRRYVIRIADELENENLMSVEPGIHKSNVYRLNIKNILASGVNNSTPRGVNPCSPRGEQEITSRSEQEITRGVNPSSLKPSVNHQLTTSESEQPLPQKKTLSTSQTIMAMLARVAGLSAIPPKELERIEQITRLIEAHGDERAENSLGSNAKKWRSTKNKNGRPYPITNMGWVDWAQAELDAGSGGSSVLTWAVWDKMTDNQRQEYIDAGGSIPYE